MTQRVPEDRYTESVLYTRVQTHGAGNSQRERERERERGREGEREERTTEQSAGEEEGGGDWSC